MPRLGLTVILLTMQLLSWSAQPLYLCLGNDGSVDVCLGPGHCDCDKSHHDEPHKCCAAHHHATDRYQPTIGSVVADKDCDCTHFLISQPPSPAAVGKLISTAAHETTLFRVTSVDPTAGLVATADRANRFDNSLLRGDASPLVLFASVAFAAESISHLFHAPSDRSTRQFRALTTFSVTV